jgi:Protein of unknown function (DUF3667)
MQGSPSSPKDASPVEPPTTGDQAKCENCGAPLYGKYCYACGQPVHGLVRHFGSVLSDIADSVLNIDERVFRTILPLYLRPGKLTLDYFAGKRARYVTPFRLVFFLAIVAFFSIQLTVRAGFSHVVDVKTPPIAGTSIRLRNAPGPETKDTHFDHGNITFNDKVVWNRETRPLTIGWLPAFANDWLNDSIENARLNMHAFNSGTVAEKKAAGQRVTLGALSAAPTVLFVLLPLFALLLKVFYIFKRRLYMEHLIVAMHSHAFLMLSMLVLVGLGVLRDWVVPHAGWSGIPISLLHAAAWIWIFVYLFLTEKRVYRQGWFFTTLKFCCIGFCYSIMVAFGMALAFLISMGGA